MPVDKNGKWYTSNAGDKYGLIPRKKDGTPDMRYKSNQQRERDRAEKPLPAHSWRSGGALEPDMRFKDPRDRMRGKKEQYIIYININN